MRRLAVWTVLLGALATAPVHGRSNMKRRANAPPRAPRP